MVPSTMIDQTNTFKLPRYRGGRLTRHDRQALDAEAKAKTAGRLATPEMVAHRVALFTAAAATASTLSRPARSL